MRKCAVLLMLVLAAGVAWGIEIGGHVGLNTQSWQDDDGHKISGLGAHLGVLGSIGITPSCLPAYIGVETGFLLQSAGYKGEDFLIEGDDMEIHMSNLVIPLLLKAQLKPSKGFHIGAGLGPSFIVHNSGNYQYDLVIHFDEEDFEKEDLATDVGFQLKGDVGIKLIPTLWLKPAITVQLNGNPDNPFNQESREGEEFTIFISVGLVFSP
ncbi:outer membrane beta-barrel protein [candidate division WOR-3 bacterium]|nr:outer membrane beta-barrel protein [candidate division WOR-3 bacterium]